MRFSLGLLFTAALLARSHDGRPVVEIQSSGVSGPMGRIVDPARASAVGVLSEAGIRLIWRLPTAGARCRKDPNHAVVVVAYSWVTPETFHPGALAITDFSVVQGPCVTIFIDRIEPMVFGNPESSRALIGYTLVHEISHFLQGTGQHSEEGVMKAHWSLRDLSALSRRSLRFTPEDASMILEALRTGARTESARAPSPRSPQ